MKLNLVGNKGYSNCFKLPPASYIEIDLNKYNQSFYCDDFEKLINSNGVKLIKYWQLKTQSNIEKFSKIKSIDSLNLAAKGNRRAKYH